MNILLVLLAFFVVLVFCIVCFTCLVIEIAKKWNDWPEDYDL